MSKASQEIVDRQAVIDRFGEVDRQAKLWTPQVNPYLKERAELLATMEGWYVNHPADQGDVAQGKAYQLEVKPCQFQRELTDSGRSKAFYRMRSIKVIDATGKVARLDPFSLFAVNLEAIKKTLGEPFLDEIAPKQRTGRRTYSVVALAKAKAA